MPEYLGTHIYKGFWVNWSHGRIQGSTLTLSASHAGLLSAFLAIFVAITGTAFWRVSSFVLHQIRAMKGVKDGIHQQQQLIFRNTNTPSAALWQMIQVSYYWRKYAKNPWSRTFPLAFFALVNLVLFIVAGVFSSEVTRVPGKGVLIRSGNCGSLTYDLKAGFTREVQAAYSSVVLNDTIEASSYVRSCYGDDPNLLQCDRYVRSQIQWKTNMNASCPFGDNLCLFGATGAIEMDTGPIDSHVVLGINAPKTDRLTYRKVATCSPIRTKGYHTLWNDTDPDHMAYGDSYDSFLFGPNGDSNFTYQYNRHGVVQNMGYSLKSFLNTGNMGPWFPIPALSRDDADTSLFFLAANSISYTGPVSDPLFSANIEISVPHAEAGNVTYYSGDYWVTALACIDQYQYCNPNNLRCTPLTGFNHTVDWIEDLDFNDRQWAVATRIAPQQLVLSMYYSVNGRGSSALRAQETVYEITQRPLPNNQWMIEVSSWFAIGVAKLQETVVRYATGPQRVPAGTMLVRPELPGDKQQCDSQIVLSPGGTVSFSVLGVGIILIVGTLILLLNSFLSTLTGKIRRELQVSDYKRVQWGLDGMFQLHRLAYEEAGQGAWTGGASTVPVTQRGDLMGVPSYQLDEKHPKLSRHDDSGQFAHQTPLMGPPTGYYPGQFSYQTPPSMGHKTPLFSYTSVDPEPDYRVDYP